MVTIPRKVCLMAFPDPISVTVEPKPAMSLSRISSTDNKSVYVTDEGDFKVTISHVYAKRNRRALRIDTTKVGADPLFPDQNQIFSASAYVVLDAPKVGFTHDELSRLVEGLATFMQATTHAEKWVTGQN
jgi:hypothetical protein